MPATGPELATAYVSISASTKGLGKDIAKAMGSPEIGKAGESAGRSISSRIGGVMKKSAIGTGVVVGGLLGGAITKGFKRLNAIDQATAKLRGLGHNAASVSKIMGNALASVKGTAFGLDEAATTAGAVVAAGIKPGKQLEGVLKTVADTATIAGTSMSDMGTIFGSVAARGKLQGDDMLQLTSRGVPVLKFLADHYGITAKKASEMVTSGKVDFKNFAEAMHENIGGAALDSGKTVQGAWKNLGASVSRIGANLLSGIFPKLQKGFVGLTKFLGPVEDKAKVVGAAIGKFLGRASAGFEGLYNLLVKGDFTHAFYKAFHVSDDSPLVANLFAVRDAAIKSFGYLKDKILPVVITGFKGLWDAAQPIIPALRDIGKALAPIFQSGGKSAHDSGPGVLAAAFALLRLAVKGLAAILSAVADFADKHGTAFRRMAVGVTAAVVAYKAYKVISTAVRGVMLGYTAVTEGVTVATKAQTWATKLGSAAAKIFAVTTRAVGIAMRFATGPIGVVITIVGLLAAGLIYAYKHSETFRKVVNGAWKAIQDGASFMWNRVLKPTFLFLTQAWLTVAGAIVHGAARAFGWVPGIGPKLKAAAAKFDTFRDEVNKSLDGIRNQQVDIVTAYNIKGPSANQQAAKLAGMGYAAGGTVTGAARAPYGDKVLTHLAPGEEVISNRNGQADRFRPLLKAINAGKVPGFANGGTVFNVRPRGLASTRARFESLAEDVGGVTSRLASALKKKLMSVVAGFGGGPHITGSYKALEALVRPLGAVITSALRPGARTTFGNLSRHALGKAIDIAPDHAIWEKLYAERGRFYELLGPWGMFLKGKPYYDPTVAAMHKNHIHLSSYADGGTVRPKVYDQGGILPPGLHTVYNGTGKGERIRTAEQEAALRQGQSVNFYGNVGWDPNEVARRIETRQRDALAMANLTGV